MNGLLRGAGIVALAVILALGWAWTDILKAQGFINDNQRLWILLGLTCVLALQQTYLVMSKPVNRAEVENRRAVTESYLHNFLSQYYDKYYELADLNGNQSILGPIIRVNVMLPTKRARGLFGTHLRIYYQACPDGVVYNDNEIATRWGRSNGTSGWAWATGQRTIFDSINPDLQAPAGRMTKAQKRTMAAIKSVLSIPIWYNSRVVGVLNLDSKENVGQTFFHLTDVFSLAEACARAVSSQCYAEGVQA